MDNQKYRNQYRIPSARAQWWDYGNDGAYFITICTADHAPHFGEIVGGKIQLSNIGVIADVLWHEIKHHAQNVEFGEFCVMPNHIHGVLILCGNDRRDNASAAPVETGHALSLPSSSPSPTPGQQRFRNQGKNTVSSIIGSYKSAVTHHVHRLFTAPIAPDAPLWQTRFYDNIIRNETEYAQIAEYVFNNAINWENDKFYQNQAEGIK